MVSAGDLVPLEYALMFMRTAPASLHIDPFNGVYYRMKVVGERIEGRLHDVDMDRLGPQFGTATRMASRGS